MDKRRRLTDAVEKHNGKNWEEISALVPGRAKQQCMSRWHNSLGSKSDETTAHVGTWTKEEDSTLKDAAEKHNGKDWAAISGKMAIYLGQQEERDDCTHGQNGQERRQHAEGCTREVKWRELGCCFRAGSSSNE
jgi:hypothetical protein